MAAELDQTQPLTADEIHNGIQNMKADLSSRIEAWGATLKPEDFERSWTGRSLNKQKRQEVCGIFQTVVDDTYQLAVENKSRLSEADQKQIDDRNLFIQSLGYKNNIVDTQMGFNCRLR
ncbi:hypothetical protein D7V32_04815 [Acinetobacter tianfuensis]|uniref:Uncharacterized protein n=2 Tax=Acinetobacter tianfuensis TaxID=2419603 RepID=A0A3A8EVB4_9GAMM|nr:hypothetical protein D7V32_04815 [Acinetobacter tianfuensis]